MYSLHIYKYLKIKQRTYNYYFFVIKFKTRKKMYEINKHIIQEQYITIDYIEYIHVQSAIK